MDPLTEDEQTQVVKHIGLLEGLSRKLKRDALSIDEAYSEGFEGLVYGLRSYDPDKGTTLKTWLTTCIRSAILDAARRESNYRRRNARLEEDPVDDRAGSTSWMWDRVNELPKHLSEVVYAYIECQGNVDRAAAHLDRPRAEVREYFDEAKNILQSGVPRAI